MSKVVRSRQVGMYIENHGDGKPILILYVDNVMLRKECESPWHAEYVYAELADVFDLWLEDSPKWIPQRDRGENSASNRSPPQET